MLLCSRRDAIHFDLKGASLNNYGVNLSALKSQDKKYSLNVLNIQ